MNNKLLLSFLLLFAVLQVGYAQTPDSQLYELRTYHCNEGKRPDLIARFQQHTTSIFEKYGMGNVGYWLSITNENDLIYMLSFPNKTARDAAWKAFLADTEWQNVYRESSKNGELIKSIDSQFITLSPTLTSVIKNKSGLENGLFELRTYYCFPDKFPNLVRRFRDHTQTLFEKHGIVNIAYWQTVEPDSSQPKLVYIIAHQNTDAAKKSWDAFRNDPEWKKVSEESQLDGKIVERVVSTYMTPLSFSEIK